MSTLMMLGRTCRRVIPTGPRPIAVAARTKSRLQSARAAPRVTRANTGTLKIAMARMALRALAPSTEVIRIAISTAGKAKIRSEVRDSASSTQPPRAAAQAPSATPADMPSATAINPTVIETWAPTMMRESTSRPRWSVPSQCCADDGRSLKRMARSSGGHGVQKSDTSAVPTNSSSSTAPIWKPTWRRARARKALTRRPSCGDPRPRIEQHVGKIDQQIHDQHQNGEQDHHVLDDDQVAVVDRVVDELADAGQAEHALDDHRTGDQEAGDQAGHRRHGNERVAQRVT